MKKIAIYTIYLLFSINARADSFTDILMIKKLTKKEKYCKLLPKVDPENPDLVFIKTRDPESMSLNNDFLQLIESTTLALNFIDTGNYLANSTQYAVNHFSKVYSIELTENLYQEAQEKLKNKPNAQLYYGNSLQILPMILKEAKGKSVIFLDPHSTLEGTDEATPTGSIINALEIIKQSSSNTNILIIDDIRTFYQPITHVNNAVVKGHPTLNNVVEKILEINSEYQFAVIYDTLVAFSANESITVSPLIRALTMSRLYDGNNYDIYDVLEAEHCIACAKTAELEALTDLAEKWIDKWSEKTGLSRHYDLWYGLILMAAPNYSKALAYFKDARKRGLKHWRVDWYIAMAETQCFFGIH